MHQRILILDYGSQVTQLIARRVREAGVYCELHPGDVSAEFLKNQLSQGLKGIILSGSHASAYDESSLKVPAEVFSAGVPVLGICYGMQAMAQQLGGEVSYADHREFGYAEVRARGHTRLLKDIDDFTLSLIHI
jgi:GMP synthase (glutamine-hydrolysing)